MRLWLGLSVLPATPYIVPVAIRVATHATTTVARIAHATRPPLARVIKNGTHAVTVALATLARHATLTVNGETIVNQPLRPCEGVQRREVEGSRHAHAPHVSVGIMAVMLASYA